MADLIDATELLNVTDTIREFVDTHDSKPLTHNLGEYMVYTAVLATPRVIGDRAAHFVRLFKGLNGGVVAGASYTEHGLEPDPLTGIEQEIPLRHVVIRAEAPPTYAFNDKTDDARNYDLTPEMLAELLKDIATAS